MTELILHPGRATLHHLAQVYADGATVRLDRACRDRVEAAARLVARVAAAGGDRHELAEPYSASRHHHHLVCVDCGVVTDFEPSRELERLIDREVAALLADHGFEPTEHLFDVRGRCRDCQTG